MDNEDHILEYTRLIHFLKRIRDTQNVSNKLVCVRTKSAKTAELLINEGVDLISDESGGAHDPNILKVISQANLPFIMSAIVKQDNTIDPIESFITNTNKKLATLANNGILNFQIGIDLNISGHSRRNAEIIIKNINKIKSSFSNNLISSHYPLLTKETLINQNIGTMSHVCEPHQKHLKHITTNGVNIIKYDTFTLMKEISEYLHVLGSNAEQMAPHIHSEEYMKLKEPPKFDLDLINKGKYKLELNSQEEVNLSIELTRVKKQDDLSNLLKKYALNSK